MVKVLQITYRILHQMRMTLYRLFKVFNRQENVVMQSLNLLLEAHPLSRSQYDLTRYIIVLSPLATL